MSPERWRQVEALYHAAIERNTSERVRFLDQACSADDGLRQEVESLLQREDSTSRFVEIPLTEVRDNADSSGPERLVSGSRVGPYEVLDRIGSGGMGEVYRARDSRLQRIVALKVLSRDKIPDAEHKQRLLREARAASALNHPNIATLYDVISMDGQEILVIEYVEGKTLDQVIPKNGMPVAKALDLSVQISGALANAHAAGIVHRDIKPGNIMVTANGTVKILDFGLAKRTEKPATGADGSTQTLDAAEFHTAEGSILGTLSYMSPEQAEGKNVDARSDIFSFGAVLWEMLTGRKAFQGDSTAATLSAILRDEPAPVSGTLKGIPNELDRLVARCLRKDRNRRVQDMADLKLALEDIETGSVPDLAPEPGSRVVTSKPGTREKLAWTAMLLLLAVVVALLAADHFRDSPQPVQSVRFSLPPPPGSSFLTWRPPAVSPDGTRVAFTAVGGDGKNTLWVRALSTSSEQQLNGTEGATYPFWSPESRRIGFFADGQLKTIEIADGVIRSLCEAHVWGGTGGSWNSTGTIVFARGVAAPLYRIQDTGGVAAPVTRITGKDNGQGHRFPFFLPDGKHFLYFVDFSAPDEPQSGGIYAGSLDVVAPKLVSSELAGNVAFASGHLLYARGPGLMAQPFDPDRLEITGPAVSISQEIETNGLGNPTSTNALWGSEFSVSQNGVLVYQAVAYSSSRLVWFDGAGKELDQLPGIGYRYPSFSPDGRSLAVSSDDARDGKYSVRVYDLARGISTRLTQGSTDICPTWSRDGKEIAYASTNGSASYIYQIPADGSGSPQVLLKGAQMVPNDWSVDGHLVFMDFAKGLPVLAIYSAQDRSVTPFAAESEAQFSPDGRWIAYAAPRGRLSGDIFVQPFPDAGGRLQISSSGGGQPRWSRDVKRIFYLTPDRKLMAVTFDPRRFSASAPELLFQTRVVAPNYAFFQYDVAPDGRFLINSLPSSFSSPLTVLTNWTAQLKR